MTTHGFMRAGALLAGGVAAGVAVMIACGMGPKPSFAQTAPAKTVTADTDSQQLRHGFVHGVACTGSFPNRSTPYQAKMADGPIVLTDIYGIYSNGSGVIAVFAVQGDCAQVCSEYLNTGGSYAHDAVWIQLLGASVSVVDLRSQRVFVPAGSTACALLGSGDGGVISVGWSGFVPY